MNNMSDLRILTGRHLLPDIEQALAFAGYDSGKREQGRAEAQRLLPLLRRTLQPKAALAFTAETLYVVLTLGQGVDRQLARYEESDAYTEAYLFNALADSCLFAWEKQVLEQLRLICQQKKVGIACRHEPGLDLPLTYQQKAVELTKAKRTLGVSLNTALVLTPAKSLSLVFDLTDAAGLFSVAHDCRQCLQTDCPGRRKKEAGRPEKIITCPPGVKLGDYLQEKKIMLPFPCGGKGVCGKCRVRVLEGKLAVTAADAAIFSPAELAAGWRLACQAVTTAPVRLAIGQDEEKFAALTLKEKEATPQLIPTHAYGLALDLGTTTLALALVDLTTGEILATRTKVNSQRAFGADVVSRIQAANSGKEALLTTAVRADIASLIQTFLTAYPGLVPEKMTLAANTTMLHLLMGWDCQGLGDYPFQPVSLGGGTYTSTVLFPQLSLSFPVTLLPGMTTYVGADIAAGLWATRLTETDEVSLFLDLGTNGEMALGSQDFLYIASAPAGPALEGGNITWGTGSIPGAISRVRIKKGKVQLKTIDHLAPVGLCGTGILEAMASLVANQLVDRTGKLTDKYFSRGFPLALTETGQTIMLNQKDIREIQMAKSAIRAGLESLLTAARQTYDRVGHVYLAGGFGTYLAPETAAVIGLLPQKLVRKTTAVGNTSLAGAVALLLEKTSVPALTAMTKQAEEIILGNDAAFQQRYIDHLNF